MGTDEPTPTKSASEKLIPDISGNNLVSCTAYNNKAKRGNKEFSEKNNKYNPGYLPSDTVSDKAQKGRGC